MSKRAKITSAILVTAGVAAALMGRTVPQHAESLIYNGDFELTQAPCPSLWIDKDGTIYNTTFGNVWCPESWVPFWYDGWACTGDPTRVTGKPEARVITKVPDPFRVFTGDQATEWFTFHRCHRGGYFQPVTLIPGQHYRACAHAHAWYSNCSSLPHAPQPLGWDCEPATWTKAALRVGIGTSVIPDTGQIEWSQPAFIYGVYGDQICTEPIKITQGTSYVILQSNAWHALRHNNVYWDNVTLERVHVTLFPYLKHGG